MIRPSRSSILSRAPVITAAAASVRAPVSFTVVAVLVLMTVVVLSGGLSAARGRSAGPVRRETTGAPGL
ncbi:hypothetical protein GCM10010359_18650 [Streptomyces morookaense]|nr:hypothetical protein GCM10010359_18650 [Streptomyces morookaense]